MSMATFLLATGLLWSVSAEPSPPARYASLEITYTLAPDDTLTERRSGEIEMGETPAPAFFRRLVLPLLNRRGDLRLLRLERVDSEGVGTAAEVGEPIRSGSLVHWDMPWMEPGQRVRFVAEQPVDLEGGPEAWWFSDSTVLPLAVREGSLVFRHPPDFSGSIDILEAERHTAGNDSHSWALDGSKISGGDSHFAISSFKNWEEFGTWAAGRCPVAPEDMAVSGWSPPEEFSAEGRARWLAKELSFRLRVHPTADRRLRYSCHSVAETLRAGAASPLEAQAVFWSVLTAHGFQARRLLAGAGLGSARPVNPDAFTEALVRVDVPEGPLWFDMELVAQNGGGLGARWERSRAFSIDRDGESWVSLAPAPEAEGPARVLAALEAVIDGAGALHANLNLRAEGPPSQLYRDAFRVRSRTQEISRLFASFLRERPIRSGPVISDPNDESRPFELRMPFRGKEFLLPIERSGRFEFNAIPLAPVPVEPSDGAFRLGAPGLYQEEITVRFPASFVAHADFRVEDDRGFAAYRSQARTEAGELRLSRELVIREEVVEASKRTAALELTREIEEDQSREYLLRRRGPADLDAWIPSVSPYQSQEMAFRAYDLMEYEAARRLLERAKGAVPANEYSWNDLGATLERLGRREEAIEAYREQIRLHPDDKYAYFNLYWSQMQQGYFEEALDNLLKQIEVNPGSRHALGNLPFVYVKLGRWSEAERAYREAARALGDDKLLAQAGVLRVCQSPVPDPRQELDDLLGPDANTIDINAVAYALSECGKELELAESYIETVISAIRGEKPQSTDALAILRLQNHLAAAVHTLGKIRLKQGKLEEAAELYRNLVNMNSNSEVLAHAAEAEWRLGRVDPALRLWKEAVFVSPGLAARMPPEALARLDGLSAWSADGVWYPVANLDASDSPVDLPVQSPVYFFVTTLPDGSVEAARALDRSDSKATGFLPAVRELTFAEVRIGGEPISTAHLIKCVATGDGGVAVFRSTTPPAADIVAAYAPEDFPLPSVPANDDD